MRGRGTRMRIWMRMRGESGGEGGIRRRKEKRRKEEG